MRFDLDNAYRTRASKAAAQALLAKVHLTLGNYSEARTLCEDIVNGGAFSLEGDFRDVFYNEDNSEVIFAIGYIPDDANDSQNFSAENLSKIENALRSRGVDFLENHIISAVIT